MHRTLEECYQKVRSSTYDVTVTVYRIIYPNVDF